MGNYHGRSSKGERKNHYSSNSGPAAYNNPASSSSGPGPGPSGSAAIPSNNMGLALPYAHVDSTLRALAAQAEGFGRCAIGGLHGPLYHVTSLAGFTLYIQFLSSVLTLVLYLEILFYL